MLEENRNANCCEAYEAALADYAEGGAPSAELRTHLERCTACRDALESARLAGELLREAIEPVAEPSGAFATRVLAQIRAQEREKNGARDLWGALEILGRRLAVTAATAFLLIAGYVGFFGPLPDRSQTNSAQVEVSDSFPALTGQPVTADDQFVAQAEVGHVR
jgi:anti-sigma factor RsiW